MTVDLKTYAADICHRYETEKEEVFFRWVLIDGDPLTPAFCHENVDRWVMANPGAKAIRGWVFLYGGRDQPTRLTAHSVVQTRDRQVIDITPADDPRLNGKRLFVRHKGDDATFFAAMNLSVFIDCANSKTDRLSI